MLPGWSCALHAHVHLRNSRGFPVAGEPAFLAPRTPCYEVPPLPTAGPPPMADQSASQTAQNVSWPGGKPIAVLVSILFETWSDGKAPSYFPRTTPLKPGTVDRGAIQWAQYGGNEGLWRILRA